MNDELKLSDYSSYFAFYSEKIITGICLILYSYIVYTFIRFNSNSLINRVFKIELLISCMIHMIPFLFFPQIGITQVKASDVIPITCAMQILLLSISIFSTIFLSTALTCIAYWKVHYSSVIEEKEKLLYILYLLFVGGYLWFLPLFFFPSLIRKVMMIIFVGLITVWLIQYIAL